jgi:membrane protein
LRAPGRRGWAFSPAGFGRRVLIGAYEDNILFLASALTFDALLAALPLALLLLAIVGYVVQSGPAAQEDLFELLHRLLPSVPAVDDPFRRAEDLFAGIVASRTELSRYGLPLFLWFATRLFSSARNALNEVFDTEESRPYLVGKALDFSLLLATLALITLNTVVTLRAAGAPWVGRFVTQVSTYALGVVLFYVVYTVSPSRRVPWDTALVAAAVASLGFEVAKGFYGLYLTNFATVDRLISNANAIAALLFVVWIYFTACVFLIGGEVAETYDLMRRQREQLAVLA